MPLDRTLPAASAAVKRFFELAPFVTLWGGGGPRRRGRAPARLSRVSLRRRRASMRRRLIPTLRPGVSPRRPARLIATLHRPPSDAAPSHCDAAPPHGDAAPSHCDAAPSHMERGVVSLRRWTIPRGTPAGLMATVHRLVSLGRPVVPGAASYRLAAPPRHRAGTRPRRLAPPDHSDGDRNAHCCAVG
jgi:hypothetical protein